MLKVLKLKNFIIILFIVIFLVCGFLIFKSYIIPKEYKLIFISDIDSFKNENTKEQGFKTLDNLVGQKNIDFLNKIKEDFLNNNVSFIEVDLTLMKLNLYIDGKMKESFNVLSKGKEGSWWETPTGLYKIESKIVNKFSNFGRVYMPYSLNFEGNFFIHGWPYYSDGSPVNSQYSGGCIRLSNNDAKKVFEMSFVGMPILIYENLELDDNFSYSVRKPKIYADSYLVADLNNNLILIGENNDNIYPIASIVKFLTAITAIEYINIEKEIVVLPEMIIPTSFPRLKVNNRYRLYDLLYPLLLESSNEAAKTISYFLGEDYFIKLVNKKSKSLGMDKTFISDSAGISKENVSSANNLLLLAKYLYHNRSYILKLSSGNLKDVVYGPTLFYGLKNFNFIIDNEKFKFIGGKIGKTSFAGENYLGVFEVNLKGHIRPIAVIVLNSKDVKTDVLNLLNYIFELYG